MQTTYRGCNLRRYPSTPPTDEETTHPARGNATLETVRDSGKERERDTLQPRWGYLPTSVSVRTQQHLHQHRQQHAVRALRLILLMLSRSYTASYCIVNVIDEPPALGD